MKDITPHADDLFTPLSPQRSVTADAIRQMLLVCPDDSGVDVLPVVDNSDDELQVPAHIRQLLNGLALSEPSRCRAVRS